MRPAADLGSSESQPVWMQHEERGSFILLRLMSRISLFFGRRVSRILVYAIALYFLLAVAPARRASAQYLKRVLPRTVTWADRYRHILAFSSTIHDRFFLLNGQTDLFDIQAHGAELIAQCHAEKKGLLLFGAHLGSFEALLDHGRRHHFNSSIAMYPENARQLNRALAAINPDAVTRIIALGQMHSMLTIHERLEQGGLVGVLADRASGPDHYLTLPFLGAPARFPTGPFRLAVMLGHPVYFMVGLYHGGNRYRLHFEPLANFGAVARSDRERVVRETMQRYVALLEQHCRAAPYNWFNFFDFWGAVPCESKPQ